MSVLADLERFAGRIGAHVERLVKEGEQELKEHVEEHPQPLFTLLRTVRPALVVHDVAIVTRYEDVVRVLSDGDSFGVEPYGEKMRALTGDFILGMDDSAAYERAVTILRMAAPRTDIPPLADFANRTAEELVAPAAGSGRLDVADVAKRLPARLMGRWFGTPGTDEDQMIVWAMSMFEDIFVNLKDDPAIHARAKQSAEGLGSYLREMVAERKAAGTVDRGDVLGRLIAMQASGGPAFGDEEIVANLVGLIVGFIPTVATAATFAIDALLDRPEALAEAQRVAQAGDEDGVRAYMWEAMRLAPQGPGLLRLARRPAVVGEGTMHATEIPAGTKVFAATESAMLDGRVVEDPDEFRVPRPPESYLHFGVGLHECFGRFANAMQIPAIARAVLRQPDLSRASGEEGKLVKEGPYPKSLVLQVG